MVNCLYLHTHITNTVFFMFMFLLLVLDSSFSLLEFSVGPEITFSGPPASIFGSRFKVFFDPGVKAHEEAPRSSRTGVNWPVGLC